MARKKQEVEVPAPDPAVSDNSLKEDQLMLATLRTVRHNLTTIELSQLVSNLLSLLVGQDLTFWLIEKGGDWPTWIILSDVALPADSYNRIARILCPLYDNTVVLEIGLRDSRSGYVSNYELK